MILRIQPGRRLSGEIIVPGDKSVAHRALLLAAIADGVSRLSALPDGEDVASTRRALEALGVEFRARRDGVLEVSGRGLHGLRRAAAPIDCGNSGTTMRLLAGILAGQGFDAVLTGDASLRRRPMSRIAEPLRAMGAVVTTRDGFPPVALAGGHVRPITYRSPVPSAQVKSCVLLAGLYAQGRTQVIEERPTRDHTERMLRLMGAGVESRTGEQNHVTLLPCERLDPLAGGPPGDVSSAAYWMAAAALSPGHDVLLPGVGVNPTRRAIIDVLRGWGAPVELSEITQQMGEPRADIRIKDPREPLLGGILDAEQSVALIDELPLLAALGPLTRDGVEIRGAAELKVKESDRIGAVCAGLRALGVEVDEFPDGLAVAGGQRVRGGTVQSRGDHRIAMTFAVLGTAAEGEVTIEGAEAAAVTYPGFFAELERLGES